MDNIELRINNKLLFLNKHVDDNSKFFLSSKVKHFIQLVREIDGWYVVICTNTLYNVEIVIDALIMMYTGIKTKRLDVPELMKRVHREMKEANQ